MIIIYIVEDIQSRDTSLSLYRYLCYYVVGTEETVETRKMLHTMRDNQRKFTVVTQITRGSGGEGLEMKGSDFDVMLVYKNVTVYEDISSARVNLTETCVAMEMEDTKLGFTRMRLLHCNNNIIWKL
jgi:hypothetical protein